MLQRHQRNNLDQLISFARDQLERDFVLLKDNVSKAVHLSKTASTLLEMYQNLSYPLVGLQVIKENLTTIKHPHSLQVEMILDKAELFYLQSVKHDLAKLKADQKIQHLSSEDIKQYIQQINWKLGFERESVLNQSQQIGDNIDLMKFFEGVRNFQNWEENLQKRTLEKLKKFAITSQNELTLRKGFIVSKVQATVMSLQRKTKRIIFDKLQRDLKVQSKLSIFKKFSHNLVKQSFALMKTVVLSKKLTPRLRDMFKAGATKIELRNLVNGFRKFGKLIINSRRLFQLLSKISQKNIMIHQFSFMKRMSINTFKKYQQIGRATQKINKISRRLGLKSIVQALRIKQLLLSRILDRIYCGRLSEMIDIIAKYATQKKLMRSAISQKIKGKVLLSIQRHENKPVNIRKAFLNWYLKSHEQNYSKKIYNIWLNGSISKFTFLMRIKNYINDGRKLKVKQELKYFLMVFMQNLNGYYRFCQKGLIVKWLEWHRYCKKMRNFLSLMDVRTRKIDTDIQREALKCVNDVARNKKYLQAYFRKKIQTMQKNLHVGFSVWKSLPNIKKAKGKARLLSFMREQIIQTVSYQKQSLQSFKYFKAVGKEKKIKLLVKTFTKDLVYLSIFFNSWRRNSVEGRMSQHHETTCLNKNKQNSLKTVVLEHRLLQNQKIRQVALKMILVGKFRKRRADHTAKTFRNLLLSSYSACLMESFSKFKFDLQQGRLKKQKLVQSLVAANKEKQLKCLQIWSTANKVRKDAEKKQKIYEFFNKTNEILKSSFINMVKSRYKSLFLQKYWSNYRSNILISLKALKNLPPRIRRQKKKMTVDLFDRLNFLLRKNQVSSYQAFKSNLAVGRFKREKIVHLLAVNWTDCLKRNFKVYWHNIKNRKKDQSHQQIINLFEASITSLKGNLDIVFQGENMRKKKSASLTRLNVKLLQRLRQCFKLWNGTAKSLTYLHHISMERKKRVLGVLQKVYQKCSGIQTKKCINNFIKNARIIRLQTNFLRKLCDSQAGKVSKALMVWKNLPQPKNKELIIRASAFERNLHQYASKVIRTAMQKFKDQLYFGNDRKKLAIRTLVARSCSGIEKYFAIWKKNNKLSLLFSQCHKLESVMKLVLQVSQKNYSHLTDRSRLARIEASFGHILAWWAKRKSRVLKIWKNKIGQLKKDQQRQAWSLRLISGFMESGQKKNVQRLLANLKKKVILRNTILRSFVVRRTRSIRSAFLNIVNLPDLPKIQRKKNKIKAVLGFFDSIQNEARNDKIKVFQIFRDEKYAGNFRKLKSCQSYLKDRISQVHKVLNLWLSLAKAEKLKMKEANVQNLFELCELINRSNYSQIFESVKSTQIKRKSIQKLCNAIEIKKRGMFGIWRSKVKEMKISKALDDAKKKNILQKINKLVFGTSQENVKKTVRNFYLNYKISSVQVKFIQRLLQTKSGKVLEAFNKWKKIPNQNLMEKYKRGQKFYFKLEGMIKNKLAEVQSSFSKNSEQGSTLKKQSVLQLLEITSSGIRRYYNRWTRITKRDQTLRQAYSMMHSLDAIQHCVAENFKILFQNEKATRIKTWAIEKLILQCKDNTWTYFKKWRQITRQINVAREFEKAKKTTALKLFANVLGGSQSLQIKAILDKFHKNAAISKISTNFLNRLLRTKSGKVVQLFEVWKSIPDAKVAKKKKKAIKFESNLNKMCGKFLRFGFEPFKSSSHQANNKKRICIEKLIRASMGEEKKKFLLWREIIKEEKMLSHTHLFDSIFQKMNENVSNSLAIIIKRAAPELEKKKNLCRKLLSNAGFVQHHSYLIWKQALQADNVKIQKTESKVISHLTNLININEKVQSRKVVQIIAALKKLHNFRNSITQGIMKQSKNKKAISFFDKLLRFGHQRVGLFFYEVLKAQRQLLLINKNKRLESSVETLNTVLSNSFAIFIQSNRQTALMEKAIDKIFQNLKISTQRAFNLWREHKNIMALQSKITDQKKKNVLEVLTKFLQKDQEIKIPFVISKFQKNYRSVKRRKQMLSKILQCKAGKVPLAFMIWKSLPNPGAKKLKMKAMKFQQGLVRLVTKNLKGSYQKFKDENQSGNVRKKNAVRKLILVTMSDSNRYFNKWRKASSEHKITQKVLALTKFFDSSIQALQLKSLMFQNSKQQFRAKKNLMEKLVSNTKVNLLWVIDSWKNTIKDQKCYRIEKILGKFEPESSNLRVMNDAFSKIRQKADKETIRTYINSLWKWKMSNVEANYYSKFIKIFKESEELITLSNCLNRKHYENLHCAFRKIMCEGSSRYHRKYRITEKYMLRKVSNYFQRFKLNACFEQIKTWRDMYKSTVKGKRIIDLIEKFARKQVHAAYRKFQIDQWSQNSIQSFELKLNNFTRLLMKDALYRIKEMATDNCCNKLSQTLHRIVCRFKRECLNQMLNKIKLEKLKESIERATKRSLMRYGLLRVQNKAVLKSRAKLAINLISCMEKQTRLNKIRSLFFKFKGNEQRLSRLSRMMGLLAEKDRQYLEQFYGILREGLDKKILLTRFKKGMAVKKILDQQDNKALRRIFGLLKKRENRWVLESVKKFVIRSNIKSTMAVSLWRLQSFEAACHQKADR